ncbi:MULTISPECIES: MFS transporter [Pseudomonas]|jgi:predicted MFS family arabinose efflux permease|uniref:MFS family arabinose efflux permease n=4 Tax=Pseudomonas TaxID=286 RepID=A0A9X8EI21_PSEPU|nr:MULTISPECIES: MFS transporter [Pseudomonas]KIU49101.1 transporter [Pseudomonas putida]KTC23783.1 transporter [Pseudomonas putida]MBG8560879.1 MFS transporter [Pseudomonas qingdaonensis]MCO7506468.1 MFS transporter [Pseudomonas sp. VE 267-6A]MCO7531735.1 MFS transporter [Pseudomonas sp. 2]
MAPATTHLSRALILLMATATGLAVASNYYAQPLLHSIAQHFGLTTATAGSIVIAAQLSYGAGLLLLAPLGDLFEQRRLIVSMIAIATVGLLISAFAPSLMWLLIGTTLTGLFSVVAQVLVPMAAGLSDPSERGRVVGTLMSGLLLGILLARTAAGFMATLGDWRSIYLLAAALMALSAIALARALPERHQHAGLKYPALIGSVFRLFVDEPVLRLRSLLGLLSFCLFALFWTPLAFLLAAEPYHYSDAVIGLFGLAGAAGALAANWAGRLADRGKGSLGTTVGLLALVLAWVPLAFAQVSLAALLIGVLVLDLAVQLVHVSNQNAVIALRPEARNRLNAGYITCYFIGGALGSLLGTQLFQAHGWNGIVVAGLVIGGVALVVWLWVERRSAQVKAA